MPRLVITGIQYTRLHFTEHLPALSTLYFLGCRWGGDASNSNEVSQLEAGWQGGGGGGGGQSVANSFSDVQIQIWILFAKDILYKNKYQYYSWYLRSQIWMRILFIKNIHEYIPIFEYIKTFENNQIPAYCYLTV